MATKEKKVFSISGFRGLDKENKPLKVEPFRATDGYNFIIDSDTLKTRPSWQLEVEPTFTFEEGDYIIDWHLFGNTRVYVTRYHFYFETNGSSFNEQAATSATFVKNGVAPSFDFQGMKPHFQEEKNCLFIFCLGNIYVFSKVDSLFVFYELRTKPANPYNVNNQEVYDLFEALPTPYEPTIWLDDKSFDDVNLLSPVSKYRLFAASATTHNGETIYRLPTVYDAEKHGAFNEETNISVEFYKNKFGSPSEITVLPVFIGVNNDNFPDGGISDFGSSFLANDPVFAEIRDVYIPPSPFKFFGTSNNVQDIISKIYGLTKDNFFTMAVKNTKSVGVFEYLMDYISGNKSLFNDANFSGGNKYVRFQMRVRYIANFYENNSSNLVEVATIEETISVYVQFKKYEPSVTSLSNETYSSNTGNYESSSITYPSAPTAPTAQITLYFNEVGGTTSPTELPADLSESAVQTEIQERASSFLAQNSNLISQSDVVNIFGKFYQTYETEVASASISLPSPSTSNFQFNTLFNQASVTYPATYPTTTNTATASATFNLGNVGFGSTITFETNTPERTLLESTIQSYVQANVGVGSGKLMFQAYGYKTSTIYDGNGNLVNVYATFKVRVEASYVVTTNAVQMQKRFYVLISGTAVIGLVPIVQDLYKLKLKELDNEIEFTLKDYLYDFNNEPTIDIKVTFSENKDYQIIADSKFGITFGSENRLFLTGNEEYPNIDRFNVSNDLLGDGTDSQSYELSYFPSKNYRVVGGKGAINGYVVATDTELYVTKKEYPNDARLFIRQRTLNDTGLVGYNEYKTSIQQTPLNERCVVRFYNDILILSKDGLYGVEISSNVLTNERLLKLRSAFINKELKQKIAETQDLSSIFMVENDRLMYIVIGKELYVADSRYINRNPNSEIENLSYEIVKWTSEIEWFGGKAYEAKFYFLQKNGQIIYGFGEQNFDEYVTPIKNTIVVSDLEDYTGTRIFQLPNAYDYIFASTSVASNYAFVFPYGYKVVGVNPVDFTESSGTVTVVDSNDFAGVTDGDTLYWKASNADIFYPFTVSGFEASDRATFTYVQASGERTRIYKSIVGQKLYISHFWSLGGDYFFRLSPSKPTSPTLITQNVGESDGDYRTRIYGLINDNEDYYFAVGLGQLNCLFEHVPLITTRWVSSITDFGNNMFEKTSFRVNVYATKQSDSNNMTFGYRTLRRQAGLSSPIDLSNEFTLQNIDYSQFSLATLDTVGFGLPMKENNFLYIQFTINGTGKIELNSIQISYKLNRLVKSVG